MSNITAWFCGLILVAWACFTLAVAFGWLL